MAKKRRKRPHGTGSYQLRNGRAQVQWTNADGTRGTQTVDLADVAAFLARANAGLVAPARHVSATMASLAAAWLAGRKEMPSWYDDCNRWKNHVAPLLGSLRPDQVTVAELKVAIAALRAKGLSKGTTGLCVALVSSLFSELVEDGVAQLNPVRLLSKKTRQRHLTSDRDPRLTPFLRERADISRVFNKLTSRHEGVARAFIIGALAGLRTGEVRALRWEHIDWANRLIHVQEQVCRRGRQMPVSLKDKESRYVPISDTLAEALRSYGRLEAADSLVCRPNGSSGFLSAHFMGEQIAEVLAELNLPAMRWYEATRHTFASQWVIEGGSLETLREMMGHSSVTTTERYAHLVPGKYTDVDRGRVVVENINDCFKDAFTN